MGVESLVDEVDDLKRIKQELEERKRITEQQVESSLIGDLIFFSHPLQRLRKHVNNTSIFIGKFSRIINYLRQ